MPCRPVLRALLVLGVAVGLTLAGVLAGPAVRPGSAAPAVRAAATRPAAGVAALHGPPYDVVALGDSVPAGTACHCTPFPELVSATIPTGGRWRRMRNLAVPGYDGADLRQQLDRRVPRRDLMRADLVLVTIGANDLSYDPRSGCAGGLWCYDRELDRMQRELDADLGVVHRLVPRSARVVVTGYWSVWQDGAVARRMGTRFVAAADLVTRAANRRLRRSAHRVGASYVGLRSVFSPDATPLLASDGDHPNARGHRAIARRLLSRLAD